MYLQDIRWPLKIRGVSEVLLSLEKYYPVIDAVVPAFWFDQILVGNSPAIVRVDSKMKSSWCPSLISRWDKPYPVSYFIHRTAQDQVPDR